jgi:four helix bundle protein
MATFQRFEEIEAWQSARRLTRELYGISQRGRFAKDYGLGSQIRRAAVSILSNIAEGFERDGAGEFLQFLAMAKGSVGEVRAQLYAALDQGYIDKMAFTDLDALARETSRMLAGLMRYLRCTSVRGQKYKTHHPSNQKPETRNLKPET